MSVAEGRGLDATRAWLLDHLHEQVTLPDMAAHACMSTRSFSRHFQNETGMSPLQWLVEQRVRSAQSLLESSDIDVESVATACGFGSPVSLRQHFRRIAGTTPTAYRSAFLEKSSA